MKKVSGAKARRLLAGTEQPDEGGRVHIWHMAVGLDEHEFEDRLITAVSRASELRNDLAVTSEQVRAQLPDPFPQFWSIPDLEWDVRSIGQTLRHLANRGRLLRCGMWSVGPGEPSVQHWAPPT